MVAHWYCLSIPDFDVTAVEVWEWINNFSTLTVHMVTYPYLDLSWCTLVKWATDLVYHLKIMMTSSNGNIFRVAAHLCGEFTGPVTWSFDVFFDLRPNKRLNKQSWGWWSETPSSSLWRHRNVVSDNRGLMISPNGQRNVERNLSNSLVIYVTADDLAPLV